MERVGCCDRVIQGAVYCVAGAWAVFDLLQGKKPTPIPPPSLVGRVGAPKTRRQPAQSPGDHQ